MLVTQRHHLHPQRSQRRHPILLRGPRLHEHRGERRFQRDRLSRQRGYTDADSHTQAHGYTHPDSETNRDTDANCNAKANGYTDADGHTHPDSETNRDTEPGTAATGYTLSRGGRHLR